MVPLKKGRIRFHGVDPEDVPAVEHYSAIRAWNHYRDAGVLPEAGGWDDQTESFQTAIDLLNSLQAVHERNEMDKLKAKAAQK